MTKKEIRAIVKEMRFALPDEKRLDYDRQIRNQLLTHLQGVKHVAIFLPIQKFKEIDLTPLLSIKEIHWYASQSFFDDRRLEFVEIFEGQKYPLSEHEIPEPEGENYINPKILDVVVIPMLISDESGFRIGYGKGFYDNFLKRISPNCKRIGVNYFAPAEKISDVEVHDEPIHLCISPEII